MQYELLLALTSFAFASSITPGPNNMMLLASGANFGFRRTVPHMLGISIGHALMVFLVGIGLAQLFIAFPILKQIMQVVAAIYMLWLAWKIANAAPASSQSTKGSPLTFGQAAAFQWVNPKAWGMALTAVTAYAPGDTVFAMVLVAATFAAVNLPSVSVWTVLGQQMQRFLTSTARLRAFNWTMAALLVGSLIFVIQT
ncbi:MAG: LysE family translocator [Pseudomonadota bacterium]